MTKQHIEIRSFSTSHKDQNLVISSQGPQTSPESLVNAQAEELFLFAAEERVSRNATIKMGGRWWHIVKQSESGSLPTL
jgi:hypothetical protein